MWCHRFGRLSGIGIIAVVLALSAGGCVSADQTEVTNEQVVMEAEPSQPASQLSSEAAIMNELAPYEDAFPGFSLSTEAGNTLVYTHVMAPATTGAQAQELAQIQAAKFAAQADQIVSELAAAGLESPGISWVYQRQDGTELARVDRT